MLTPLDRRSLRVTHGGSSREPSRSYLYGQELSRAVGLRWSHTIRTLFLSLAIVAISLYHFASSDMCIIPSHLHLEQGVIYHLSSLSSFKISRLRRRKKLPWMHWKHLDIQNSYPSHFRTLNQRFLTLEQKPFNVKSHT
jgi:hypothetical protein